MENPTFHWYFLLRARVYTDFQGFVRYLKVFHCGETFLNKYKVGAIVAASRKFIHATMLRNTDTSLPDQTKQRNPAS